MIDDAALDALMQKIEGSYLGVLIRKGDRNPKDTGYVLGNVATCNLVLMYDAIAALRAELSEERKRFDQMWKERDELRAALLAFVEAAERGATNFYNLRGSCLRRAYEALGMESRSSNARLRSAREAADDVSTPIAKETLR